MQFTKTVVLIENTGACVCVYMFMGLSMWCDQVSGDGVVDRSQYVR